MSGLKDLVKLAGRLDSLGLEREAGVLRSAFRKMAGVYNPATGQVEGDDVTTMEAPVGGSDDWKKGMPWPNTYDPNSSSGPQGMAAGKAYPSKPAPTYGTHMDPEFAFARWVGSQDIVSKQAERSAFERQFHRLWRMNKNSKGADPNGKYTPAQWIELGLKFAPEIWESMQDRSVSAPKPAPKPKAPMTDEQRWDAYAKRVAGGDAVKFMWVRSGAGIALTGDASFESFRKWMPTMMNATGIKNISATQLVGKLSDFKAAALADKANNRTPGAAQGSILTRLYDALKSGNTAEYSRMTDSLAAGTRVRSEQQRVQDQKAKSQKEWEAGLPDLERENPTYR